MLRLRSFQCMIQQHCVQRQSYQLVALVLSTSTGHNAQVHGLVYGRQRPAWIFKKCAS